MSPSAAADRASGCLPAASVGEPDQGADAGGAGTLGQVDHGSQSLAARLPRTAELGKEVGMREARARAAGPAAGSRTRHPGPSRHRSRSSASVACPALPRGDRPAAVRGRRPGSGLGLDLGFASARRWGIVLSASRCPFATPAWTRGARCPAVPDPCGHARPALPASEAKGSGVAVDRSSRRSGLLEIDVVRLHRRPPLGRACRAGRSDRRRHQVDGSATTRTSPVGLHALCQAEDPRAHGPPGAPLRRAWSRGAGRTQSSPSSWPGGDQRPAQVKSNSPPVRGSTGRSRDR